MLLNGLKKGKQSGRPIGDLSCVSDTPLNSRTGTDAAALHYGLICHPTIEDNSKIMLNFWNKETTSPTAKWSNLRFWKMDLKGSCTLLPFRPKDVGLSAIKLTGDLVYVQISGIFE